MFPDDRCCSEDYGGSHYHCARCQEVCGSHGHYVVSAKKPCVDLDYDEFMEHVVEKLPPTKAGRALTSNSTWASFSRRP
jgi:hypothetical protein